MKYELFIHHGNEIIFPVVLDEIKLTSERRGAPETLRFTVLKDSGLNFTEGDAVSLKVDGKKVFFGFVFTKKRDKEQQIEVTAYSQLRYLTNKDTYVYANKRASDVLSMIAKDFNLQLGSVDNTQYVIPKQIEENSTLFDIILNALDKTLLATGVQYILYDDYGKLTLKSIQNMKLDLLVDAETGENFTYESSIDENTYNKIKLCYKNDETGVTDVYVAQDSQHFNEWGILQFFESIDKSVANPQVRANNLLRLYNQKTRKLKIDKAFGDVRVRGGSFIGVALNVGDIIVQNFMMVENVTHNFTESHHSMDLTLRGGEFIA